VLKREADGGGRRERVNRPCQNVCKQKRSTERREKTRAVARGEKGKLQGQRSGKGIGSAPPLWLRDTLTEGIGEGAGDVNFKTKRGQNASVGN